MKRLIIISIIAGFSCFIVSCYYDNEEALYPQLNTACDTSNITFSLTIVTMLSDNCYSCHSNANAAANGNNIRLQDHADVVANNVDISNSIKHIGSKSPMPKNGGQISDCSITQFDIWVRNGMPDN
jgi:hypothetical protein